MIVHVINLARSPDRWEEFQRVNADIPDIRFRRFDAIDGYKFDMNDVIASGFALEEMEKFYSSGTIGCAMSHVALWDKAISLEKPVTVCEDDAILHRDFAQHAEAMMRDIRPHWDIILWSWNFRASLVFEMVPGVSACTGYFEAARMTKEAGAFRDSPILPRPFRLFSSVGLMCYSISPAGAKALKSRVLPLRPMQVKYPERETPIDNTDLDIAMAGFYREIAAAVCFPPLAISKDEPEKSTTPFKPEYHS